MIKVIEAISDVNIGGAGILLLNRLKNSDRKLFNTVVVLPKQSLLREKFEKIGVKTYGVNGGERSFSLIGLYSYYKALKCLKPDIINSHGSLNSRVAAWLTRTTVKIYTRHCVYPVSKIYNLGAVRYTVVVVT